MKTMKINKSNFLSLLFLAVFIPATAAPVKTAAVSKRAVKSEYNYKKSKCNCPALKEYKKYTGYNKYLNKPKRKG